MITRAKLKEVLKRQILSQAELGDSDTLDNVLMHLNDDELHHHIYDFNRYQLNQ